jgi:hypothetical protein
MLELTEKCRLGRLTRREDKLKTVLEEVSCGDVKRRKLVKAYVRWRALVLTVSNFRILLPVFIGQLILQHGKSGARYERSFYRFQPSVCIRLHNKIAHATSKSHIKSWKWTCSQYRTRRSQTENIRGLHLAVVKLTTVQVTKLTL